MTDAQLYLAIGMPSIAALIGILVNVSYFVGLNGRFNSMDGRINSLEGRMSSLETRLDKRIDDLGKRIGDVDKHIDDQLAAFQKHIDQKIDNAFDHIKLLLELHEAKHHSN